MNGMEEYQPPDPRMMDHDWGEFLRRPIAFHRTLVKITGSVNAALMLSQAIYWQRRVPDMAGGWWYKTRHQWTEETGLTEREQENARKKLNKAGLIREDKRGMPAKMWFQVHPAVLMGFLSKTKDGLNPWKTDPWTKPPDKKDSDLAIETINWVKVLSRPIAFHRSFVGLTGSVNAALMLSQAFYWQHRVTEGHGGWWYKTQSQWTRETGLSRCKQENARKQLRNAGIIVEKRLNMPAKTWYRLDQALLWDLLVSLKAPVDNSELSNQAIAPEANKINSTAQTDQLNCTETPTAPHTTLEASKFNSTDQTDIQDSSMSVCAPQECEFAHHYYKETEITTETTPPPQTPPPQPDGKIQVRGGGGEKTKPGTEPPVRVKPGTDPPKAGPDGPLEYPRELSGPEREAAERLLAPCHHASQEILDVLAVIIRAGQVRKSPVAVLRGLVKRWQAGSFDPADGLHLAITRQRQAMVQRQMRKTPLSARRSSPDPGSSSKKAPPGAIEAMRQALKGVSAIADTVVETASDAPDG